MKRRLQAGSALAILAILLLTLTVHGQGSGSSITLTWDAPTSGGAVVSYNVQA